MIEDVRSTFLHDRPLLSIIAVGLFLLSLPFCCFAAVMVRYPDPADGTLVSLGPLSIQGQRIADPRCDQNHCWADYQIALMFQASSETHTLPLFILRVQNHINASFGNLRWFQPMILQ